MVKTRRDGGIGAWDRLCASIASVGVRWREGSGEGETREWAQSKWKDERPTWRGWSPGLGFLEIREYLRVHLMHRSVYATLNFTSCRLGPAWISRQFTRVNANTALVECERLCSPRDLRRRRIIVMSHWRRFYGVSRDSDPHRYNSLWKRITHRLGGIIALVPNSFPTPWKLLLVAEV